MANSGGALPFLPTALPYPLQKTVEWRIFGKMKPYLSLFMGLAFAGTAFGQTVLEGRLLDAGTKESLPFAGVGISHSTRGTISNSEGSFRLETLPGDTLLFSFLGYHTLALPATAFPANGEIYLQSRGISLKAATILASDFLYALLAGCKKAPAAPTYTAKTYFELNSIIAGQPIERIEMYYNGQFSGTHIDELQFKNGRASLATYLNRHFLNLETSKAVAMLNILGPNFYFPNHPFHLAKAKMRKAYQLNLVDTYRDSGTVYVVQFAPRDSDGTHFGGQVWVDSASNRIQKLNLQVENAKPYPFRPQWPSDSIKQVDMELTYAFKNRNGNYVFDVVNCTYRVRYKGRGAPFTVLVQCVLRAYDYDHTFRLPLYEYNTEMSDYRKLTEVPHNAFFWAHRDSLVVTNQQQINRSYFEHRGVSLSGIDKLGLRKRFFEFSAIPWSEVSRLNMKSLTDTAALPKTTQSVIYSEQYKLKAQLYMDINSYDDSLHAFTATVFDVFDGYYRAPLDSLTDCFINIYFDLYEIERRLLEKDLQQPGLSADAMTALHRRHTENVQQLGQRYLHEVERGQNKDALEKWNRYIFDRLNMDNMYLFRLHNTPYIIENR